jgi:hypothetical protein
MNMETVESCDHVIWDNVIFPNRSFQLHRRIDGGLAAKGASRVPIEQDARAGRNYLWTIARNRTAGRVENFRAEA